MFEWSDIRTFLALARGGSALTAAKHLNTNQTTVSRRIDRLEHALKLRLFEKSTRGYTLTKNGAELIPIAENMELAAQQIDGHSTRLVREISGTIRFSGLVVTMRMYGVPLMEMFRKAYPNVLFELDTQDHFVSLENGQADIALRSADQIEGDTLIARKIDMQPFGLYCGKEYAAKHGRPRSLKDLPRHTMLDYGDNLKASNSCIRWMASKMPVDRVVFRVDSPAGMAVALKAGAGVGLLPRVVGEDEAELDFCFGHPSLMHPIWIVASSQSYATPLVRTFLDFFAANFKKVRRVFPDEAIET
ncbi:MAG: LysR family transcriptional regulator [Rhizobiaceae bacterium]|nr:LysR family transcriptional regulator [Rhizobiaceae bacterium]